ncbi:MAG TPA: ABC transporter permease [Streptosporangiaceae bacterium]|jgi:putative ABC transport system permease protein
MFITYLLRELRRRARQAILIALGLALGVGLVITVTAASSGVKNAQAQVLHSLYGVGTDITVTQAPAAGTGRFGGFGFGFGGNGGTGTRPKAGTKIDQNRVTTGQYGPVGSSSVTTISKLKNVAGASGALALTDIRISLTIGNFNGGIGGSGGSGGAPSGRGNFKPPVTFSVSGVDLSTGALGPLASAKLATGRTFTTSDTTSNVAVVDSNYAKQNKIKVGSIVQIGNSAGKSTNFTVVGVVSTPSGTGSDFYIPLARAQALSDQKNKVNTVYVAAQNATHISTVSKQIKTLMPKATVTTASSLASEVTGSLASASSLANSLGKWLAIAVLVAAFALAALLTMSAVSRRVREFGTLKALGWRSKRIVGQVMGEALTIGVIGGIVGVGLGYLGALLVGHFAPPLSAAVGQTTGSATPGGGRVFRPGGFGGTGGGGGGFRPPGSGGFGRLASNPTVTVHLSAPVTISIIGAAVLLAIIGGLIAGGFGSWRAASLRPAAALAKVA